jgi:hypothetical protein
MPGEPGAAAVALFATVLAACTLLLVWQAQREEELREEQEKELKKQKSRKLVKFN